MTHFQTQTTAFLNWHHPQCNTVKGVALLRNNDVERMELSLLCGIKTLMGRLDTSRHIAFFHLFITMPNNCLTCLMSETLVAVTKKGKLCNENTKGVVDLTDCILAIDKDNICERGDGNQSDEEG